MLVPNQQHQSIVTFHVKHSRGEVYIGHGRLFVCLSMCLSLSAFPHYCTDPDVTWGNGRGCPLVVHYWVHRFHIYDSIAPNAKCQRVLVLVPCLVLVFVLLRDRPGFPDKNLKLDFWSRFMTTMVVDEKSNCSKL